jgi:hypothetical protein
LILLIEICESFNGIDVARLTRFRTLDLFDFTVFFGIFVCILCILCVFLKSFLAVLVLYQIVEGDLASRW